MYIHEKDNRTLFRWDASVLTAILEAVGRKQGLLYRTMFCGCRKICDNHFASKFFFYGIGYMLMDCF